MAKKFRPAPDGGGKSRELICMLLGCSVPPIILRELSVGSDHCFELSKRRTFLG